MRTMEELYRLVDRLQGKIRDLSNAYYSENKIIRPTFEQWKACMKTPAIKSWQRACSECEYRIYKAYKARKETA